MEKKDIAEFFDRCAPWWDDDMIRQENIIAQILDNGGIREGLHVLDVACGTGVLFPDYLKRNVASVTGIGQFREMLAVLFGQLNAMEDANSRFSQVVRDAKSFIAQHIHEPELGLKEIAAQVNFSAAYLNVVFRTETGMTVKQYLIDRRITEAKRLLKEPSVRISEIAQRCGYSNSNYFAKAFKESTGMTPGEYRERKV